MNRIFSLLLLALLMSFAACQKFEAPTCELEVIPSENSLYYNFYAVVTDGGGFESFLERGYCYSLHENPNILDRKETTTVDVECEEHLWGFRWVMNFPIYDTVYYVRAYVKNNADIGYSNTVTIENRY